MRNYSYNKLFDFIKSKLNAQEQADWNTPPDFVFENAIKTVNKRKKRRKFLLYRKIGGIAGILLLLGSFLFINNRVEKIESKVTNLTNTQSIMPSQESGIIDDNKINNNIAKTVELQTAKSLSRAENNNTLITNPNNKKSNSDSQSLIENHDNINTTDSHSNSLQDQVIENIKSPVANTVNSIIKTEEAIDDSKANTLSLMSPLYTLDNFILIERDEVTIEGLQSVPAESTKTKLPMTIGFSLINNYSHIYMDNISMNDNLSLTGYEKQYAGYGFSLDLTKALTKNIYVKATGQVQKIKNNSNLREESAINADNYTAITNEEGTYATTVNMATPFGEYECDIDFLIDENTVNRSTNMINETTINQSFTYTSFDLGGQYIFNPESDLSLFLGTGVGINMTSGLRNNMESEIYIDDSIVDRIDTSPTQLDDFKSLFWSYYGEAGAQLSINDSSYFSMSVSHRASINSIREAGFTGSSSYLRQINIGVGYNLRF